MYICLLYTYTYSRGFRRSEHLALGCGSGGSGGQGRNRCFTATSFTTRFTTRFTTSFTTSFNTSFTAQHHLLGSRLRGDIFFSWDTLFLMEYFFPPPCSGCGSGGQGPNRCFTTSFTTSFTTIFTTSFTRPELPPPSKVGPFVSSWPS